MNIPQQTEPDTVDRPASGPIVMLEPVDGGSVEALAAILRRIARYTLEQDAPAVVQSDRAA